MSGFIAATNENPQESYSGGSIRSDLFYRWKRFPNDVPPLRGARADISQLAFFLARFSKKVAKERGKENSKHARGDSSTDS